MAPSRNYTNPVSYKTLPPTGTEKIPGDIYPRNVLVPSGKSLLYYRRTLINVVPGAKKPDLSNIPIPDETPRPSRLIIKITTYPPVYRTILGADKSVGQFTNIFKTPRMFPPLQGTKNNT